jgi:opacity protein-like surface antigen
MRSGWRGSLLAGTAVAMLAATNAARGDDEIQVYNGEIADVGKWTGQHHFNYAIQGRREPDFPGGIVPNHTLNATPEFAYGVTPWFEAGFYVPWAVDKDGYQSNAMKLRTLFVTPDAAKREFFYGLNLEYQYLMPRFSQSRFGMEIRPIIGWRKGDYEFIVNPILDLAFGKDGDIAFAPNARLARNFGEDFAIAVEYYTDLGTPFHFLPLREQKHNIFGVVDFKVGRFDIEFGVGYGLTNPGSDRWLTKLMITTDLYDKKEDKDGKKAMASAKAPVRKAPEKATVEPPYDYAGCYAGGYFGGSYSGDVETADPVTAGGVFYNAGVANGGAYRVRFKETPIGGATLGCNWHAPGSAFIFGAEGETGYMQLRAVAVDPYSDPFNDTLDRTVIGNWYGAFAGRFGWAYERALFYGKTGVGFTGLRSSVTDFCNTGACGGGLLNASRSDTRAFLVAGGGIEWAWTGNWTVKMEYLFLNVTDDAAVCGAGAGTAAGATFCAPHHLQGVHTTKLGINYKIY